MGRLILPATISLIPVCPIGSASAAEPRSFYDGKTINLIVSTSPGGATDVAGRLVSRYLGKYIQRTGSFITISSICKIQVTVWAS